MPTFSSGPILNTGTSPSTVLNIIVSNEDLTGTATIELEVFLVGLSATATPKIPVLHQLFSLPPLAVTTRTAAIAGFPAYETQLNVTGSNVVIDVFASDAAGNMNAAQRVLQAEQSPISAITPVL
ncbi:hypothetical protein GZH47_25200 [Paenibacillus rhizovicinus]|uniref:Uncharacterized protein n=1 Tax=Paenibacillus rhizovicinus TaxID=2704463 RepID=A0A6C0P5H4_9BACL|nr:hypothetical protein [Paenibacillus rhizovicinus]QHW33769.1 hypothetical protein GZH47_25200 [Paenibacillus rhizovicinus]